MQKLFKYTFLTFLHLFFYGMTYIIPKDKNTWIFGAWEGELYADNAKYFFEWIKHEKKDINAVWVTRNKKIYDSLINSNNNVVLFYTWKWFLLLSRAAVVIETEGNADIGGFKPGGALIVQLWHGVAPKNSKYLNRYGFIKRKIREIVFDKHSTSYWMFSSQKNKEVMCDAHQIPEMQGFITGYPRNDVLIIRNNNNPIIEELEYNYPHHRKIIYMPTHRNFGSNGMAFNIKELKKVDDFLIENKIIMVFKPHFHELKNMLKFENEFSNIVFAKEQEKYSDVYSYISGFDLLISDYSSIIYDFLCTGKPIVLFPYDLNTFKETDGIFDYYTNVPCGPLCFSWNQVLNEAFSLLESDNWKGKREECRKLFHPFKDGKNSERVYCSIVQLLKK